MIKQVTTFFALALLLFTTSCGDSKKKNDADLAEKKEQLQKLKDAQQKQADEIKMLETELAKRDTTQATAQKAKLVALQPLKDTVFEHFIELQGKVDAENISYVTPRGAGGQVKAVLVKQGDHVRKGQLLMRLDNTIQSQSLVAARQGLETIKTQLTYAKDIYQRQKNLWENNIGTEVQLITAKNNVASLENQLKAAQENVGVVAEQLNTSNVYADVSGIADVVNIRVGETFSAQGAQPAQAGQLPSGIKIVNTSSLKVISNIPENYVGSVQTGTQVEVNIVDANKKFRSTVSFLGASIDALNRGFVVEARLPNDPALKPNQIALLRLKDYANTRAIIIPLNTLQNDEKGKFVMVASKENGKLIARKRPVNIGQMNNDQLEIKAGLQAGDVLITEGFQPLYDGIPITTQ